MSNREGRTQLHVACIDGNVELVQALIDGGSSLSAKDIWGKEPMFYAMLTGQVAIVHKLANAGARLSDESKMEMANRYCCSAADGDIKTLKKMLACNIPIDSVDYSRQSALQLAALHGRAEVVKFLVDLGVDIYFQNLWGKTAMDYAEVGGYRDVLQLLRCSANMAMKDNYACEPD